MSGSFLFTQKGVTDDSQPTLSGGHTLHTETTMENASKLLINESPVLILPSLACKIGLNEAIVLQQVQYWVSLVQKKKDASRFVDGCWWTYNTYQEWHDNFPWWSITTIRRIIYGLEKKGLLISRQPNSSNWDHTKWYAIDYDRLNELTDTSNLDASMCPDCADQSAQDELNLIRYSETSTETYTRAPQKKNQDHPEGSPATPIMADVTDINLDDNLDDDNEAVVPPPLIGEVSQPTPATPPSSSDDEWDKLLSDPTLTPEQWGELAARRPMRNPPKPAMTEQDYKERIKQALGRADERGAQRQTDLSFVREGVRELAYAFVNHFGRGPLPAEKSYWIKEFDAWGQISLKPADVEKAMSLMDKQGLSIKSPASVTAMAWDGVRKQLEAARPYQPPAGARMGVT